MVPKTYQRTSILWIKCSKSAYPIFFKLPFINFTISESYASIPFFQIKLQFSFINPPFFSNIPQIIRVKSSWEFFRNIIVNFSFPMQFIIFSLTLVAQLTVMIVQPAISIHESVFPFSLVSLFPWKNIFTKSFLFPINYISFVNTSIYIINQNNLIILIILDFWALIYVFWNFILSNLRVFKLKIR